MRPGIAASDDLSLSKLPVGDTFSYCVRAIKEGHNMASPDDGSIDTPVLLSSDSTCASHTIGWESSLTGHVTTRDSDADVDADLSLEHWVASSFGGWNIVVLRLPCQEPISNVQVGIIHCHLLPCLSHLQVWRR